MSLSQTILIKHSSLLNSQPTSFHGFHFHNFSSLLCLPRPIRIERRWVRRQQMRLLIGISLPLSSPLHHSLHRCFHSSNGKVPSLLSHSFPLTVSQQKLLIKNPHFHNMSRRRTPSLASPRFGCFGKNPFLLELGFSRKDEEIDKSDSFGETPFHVLESNEFVLRRNMTRVMTWDMGRYGNSFYHNNLSSKLCFGETPFCLSHSLRREEVTLNLRSFSSVSGRDSDVEGEKEENGGVDGGENEGFESKADPEEVERVCNVIEELFASDRNMEGVLDQCGVDLSHDLVVDVLARFQHARRPAFRFFCWAGEKPGFEHDSRTYNSMMRILGKTRQFESMIGMLEEMGKKGLLTIETFAIAIRAFAAEREMKKAMGLFELMKRHNFKTGVDMFNCLLDALGRAKLAKEAQALFEKLKDRFTPDLKTYSVLLAGWCKVRKLIEAGRVWNEMIDMGMKPDIVTHNIMLEGLLKGRRNSEAIKLFELMKAKGPLPNVRSYTILIRDLCKANKMDQAVEYFDEMLDAGCPPDPAVYTCLIVGFGNQKKMHKVYEFLQEMKENGCPPDGQTFNALIKLMTNRQMPDNAVRIYKKMLQSGYQPTVHTYNMMMKSYFQMKNYEMGNAVWGEMIQKGCCPDDNSYTVFIGGLIRVGRSEEACKYIEEMIEKGMKAPQLDYNKFAADYSRVGKPNILEELAQKMKFSGKFEESNVFSRWSEMIKKPVKQSDPDKVRHRFT